MHASTNRLISLIICTLFTMAFASAAIAQQKATIRGQVTNENQNAIADINIGLKETGLGSASDAKGNFVIRRIPAGTYTIVASGVSYSTVRKEVAIKSGQTLRVDVQLSRSNQQLQEIVISADKVNKFTDESSEFVAKMPISDIENPQVYNTVSSELLADQLTTTFDDALKNAPGIHKLWESTGRGSGAGYYSLRGFSVQPQMTNGLPSLTNGMLDPVNIEKIEIIKGPSAALFGNSVTSYGGFVNVVTKKPYKSPGGDISYKTGSFGLNRVTADVNTPIEDNLFMRVTGAYEKRNSFQNAGFSESFFIAPSLRYEAGEDLSFSVNTEFYRPEKTNPLMLFLNRSDALEANTISELNYDNDLSYTTNDLTIKNPTFSLQGQMNYRISDQWKSQTVVSSSTTQSDGYYSYVSTIGLPGNTYGRYISDQNSNRGGRNIQQNFIGDFNIGSINNKVVAGLDYFQENVTNNSTGYVAYDQIDLQNPDPPAISRASLDTMLASASVANSETRQQVYSAYVSDVIEFMPQLSAMVSLRLDHFVNDGNTRTEEDDFEQTTLSPKFGLIFQPIPGRLSLFANYMNGFTNVAPVEQGDGSVETFEPEQANQWETGVKTNLLNGRISATASYYDITVSNILQQDPNRPNFTVQGGENYSRGVEFSVTASPAPGLNIIAGYSYNDSEVLESTDDFFAFEGLRPEYAGPDKLANTWVSYQFTGNMLNGFGVGLGGNYASENKIINRPATGVFTLPSYTVFNASVFYNTSSYRLDLKMNNLNDKEYYNGWSTINPQAPRSITAGFTYKF